MRRVVSLIAVLLAVSNAQAADSDVWGYWSFDDSSAAVALDASPNHNDAYPNNGGPAVTQGQTGLGRLFVLGDYLIIPRGSSPAPDQAITVEAWINPTGNFSLPNFILSKEEPYARWGDYQFYVGDDACLGFGICTGSGGSWVNLRATEAIPINTWTHVAATYDDVTKECILYYNGREVAGTHFSGANLNARDLPLFVGKNGCRDRFYFDGRMDDVRISSVVRDITPLTFGAPVEPGDPSVWGYYSFEEPEGGVAFDGSGHHNSALPPCPEVVPGRRGLGRKFREGGWLVVPQNATPAPDRALTVEAWVNPSADFSNPQCIVARDGAGTNQGVYRLVIGQDSCLHFEVMTASWQWVSLQATETIPAGEWTHVMATFDDSTKLCALYYDFRLVARGFLKKGRLGPAGLPVYIGTDARYERNQFKGTMDEVRILSSVRCCLFSTLGNVDDSPDGIVSMGDLTALIDNLFISLTPLTCTHAGNLDLSKDGAITMGDLTVLIDHLFISLAPLPPCE